MSLLLRGKKRPPEDPETLEDLEGFSSSDIAVVEGGAEVAVDAVSAIV